MGPSPTIRRLLKETAELSSAAKNPNPTFHAAPISEDNLHEWHFTLLGPPAPSLYAGGIYHGRITLPPAYPMKPPNFRFLTPSGRFEVNREICLSISGFHEETWQPAWGVRLALTALRGFMGEEGTAGQVGGLESPKEVILRLARESKSWKCQSCGEADGENKKGWTNEERMKWWWDICREKGVNVEAEVEGLEALPEDVKVEAREVKQDKGKQKATETDEVNQSQISTTIPDTTSPVTKAQIALPNPADLPAIGTRPIQQAQSQASISHTRGVSLPQIPTQNTAQLQLQQARRQDSPLSIDRAITAVFLALCVMVLKRIFYPSTSGSLFGGHDDLKMLRE